MTCKCGNDKLIQVSGKVSDLCCASYDGVSTEGYAPRGIGVGGGDYLEFKYCPKCMTIQAPPPSEDDLLEAFPQKGTDEEEEW
jgi:hypothetical protein